MGLDIGLSNDDPRWEWKRSGNYKDFPLVYFGADTEFIEERPDEPYCTSWDGSRPIDFTAVHRAIDATEWEDKDRWHFLINLLEEDDAAFVYFSN